MTSGSFSDFETQEVLLRLSERRAIGTMIVQAAGDVLTVAFDKGRVVSADLNESFEDGLGRELVRQGLLNDVDAAQIHRQELRSQSQIIDHLLARGLVPADQLQGVLRSYVLGLIMRAFGWNNSEFTYFDSEAATRREGFDPISVEELLVRASEENTGILQAVVPLLGSSTYALVARDAGAEHTVAGREESLSNLELAVLKGVDGRTAARDYERRLKLNPYRIRFALYRLLSKGVIEASEQSEVEQVIADLLDEPSGVAPAPDFLPELAEAESASGAVRSLLRLPFGGDSDGPGWRQELRDLYQQVAAGWSFALGVLLAVSLLGAVLSGSSRGHLFYPLPWQDGARLESISVQRAAAYRRIERAASTYALVTGRLPQELDQLVEAELLRPEDLNDPSGEWLVYAPLTSGYTLEPGVGGGVFEGAVARFETVGDFMLDPDYAGGESTAQRQPLVLLN